MIMQTWWLTLLGIAAGLCTSFSFVPQVIKAWREGDTQGDLQAHVRGIADRLRTLDHARAEIGSMPVILFNGANVVFAGIILALKLRSEKAAEVH
jgi:MtN3 and saliva related transmembrane protein